MSNHINITIAMRPSNDKSPFAGINNESLFKKFFKLFRRQKTFHVEKFLKEFHENPPKVRSLIDGGYVGEPFDDEPSHKCAHRKQ